MHPLRALSSPFVLAGFVLASAAVGAGLATVGCGGGSGSSSSTGGSGGTGGAGGTTSSSTDTSTECFDYSGFDGMNPAVSFKADVLPVFQYSCGVSETSCHGSPTPAKPAQVYLGPNKDVVPTADDIVMILGGIVDKASVTEPSMKIVATGDPEKSFMMYKLDNQVRCAKLPCAAAEECGSMMPQTLKEPIDEASRDAIRRWIAQGAQNN